MRCHKTSHLDLDYLSNKLNICDFQHNKVTYKSVSTISLINNLPVHVSKYSLLEFLFIETSDSKKISSCDKVKEQYERSTSCFRRNDI